MKNPSLIRQPSTLQNVSQYQYHELFLFNAHASYPEITIYIKTYLVKGACIVVR